MKIKLLKSSKFYLFVLMLLSLSCSNETEINETPLPVLHSGTLSGSVKLFNKYGVENSNFNDLKIKLIDSLNTSRLLDLDSAGTFKIDGIPYGNLFLLIDKAGYGIVDTLSFNLQKKIDTLSTIRLAEELPLSYESFSIYYGNKMIHYNRSTTYKTNDSYLVGELICFGKDPNVSLNNNTFFMGTGSFSNVSTINWTISSSTSCSLENFTNNGLQIGDRIYAVCYPIIHASFTLYNGQNQNFEIKSYKIGNPSNAGSFILHE